MLRVIPTWTVEYKYGPSEESKSHRVNADSLFEVLQHFQKFNHGVADPYWLRVTREELGPNIQAGVTTGSYPAKAV